MWNHHFTGCGFSITGLIQTGLGWPCLEPEPSEIPLNSPCSVTGSESGVKSFSLNLQLSLQLLNCPPKSTESSSEKPLKCPSDTREEEEEAPDPSLGGLWMAELRMSGIHPLPLLNLMNSPSPLLKFEKFTLILC